MAHPGSLRSAGVIVFGGVLLAFAASAGAQYLYPHRMSVPSSGLPRDARQMDGPQWRATVQAMGIDPDDVVQPFVVTPEMNAWVRQVTAGVSSPLVRLIRIQQALFSDDFTYDPSLTLTAQETFAQRRGNCMAFTVLFVALSRSVGLHTFVLSVPRVEDVTRYGDLVVVSQHVLAGYPVAGRVHLYDFFLNTETFSGTYEILDDLSVAALFQSNTGVTMLRGGDSMGALEQFEIATWLDPDLPAGWINLGVARRRLDDISGAFDAYERALKLDPGNSSALANLGALYHQMGRASEAHAALTAAARDSDSPFTLIALADLELVRGDRAEAARLMRRARRLGRDDPAVFRALARWAEQAGQANEAERYRIRARRLEAKQDDDVRVLTPGVQ